MHGSGSASGSVRAKPRVGFVGLGTMGGPMCQRLTSAGYEVTAYDLDRAALADAETAGASAADSVVECARTADVFITSLPGPPQAKAVMAPPGGAIDALAPGAVWVDLTTNSRELLMELAAAAPEGVMVVDSPVTGAVDGARQGRLTLFVGGDPQAIAVVRPMLEHLGTVIECGPLGTGNVVKLVTNQLWFAAAAALGEGFAVGVANGVDLRTLWDAILDSVGDSFVARHDAPSVFAGHYDPSFPLSLCVKDLGLLARLESAVGTDLPITAAARGAFERAAQRYGENSGEMCVARRIADDAGISMRLEGDWTPPWEA